MFYACCCISSLGMIDNSPIHEHIRENSGGRLEPDAVTSYLRLFLFILIHLHDQPNIHY